MNLSSMYGITLPVLLFSLEKEEAVTLLKSIDSKSNAFIVDDFKKALNYMQQLGDVVTIGRVGAPQLTDVLKRTPITKLSAEEQITVNNAIKFLVITEIAKLELAGHLLAASFELEQFLGEINQTSYVKARRSVQELLPKHVAVDGEGQAFRLLLEYNLDIILPDKLNDVELTELDKKILKFYYLRLVEYAPDIQTTLDNLPNLDTEAVNLLLRKPRAMYYRVYDELAPLQDVTTVSVLNKSIEDLRMRMTLQLESLGKTCEVGELDPSIYVGKVETEFTVANLNQRFEVELKDEEWLTEFEKLDELCICGMNLDTRELSEDARRDFLPKTGLVLNDTNLQEYTDVIEDIIAALDSLIAFNTPIV